MTRSDANGARGEAVPQQRKGDDIMSLDEAHGCAQTMIEGLLLLGVSALASRFLRRHLIEGFADISSNRIE